MQAKTNVGSHKTSVFKKKVSQKKQRGVAAVEFALVAPILLLIVFGIVELGIGLYDKAVITNAAREGARAGIVLKSPSKPTATDIQNVVLNYTSSYLITFGTKNDPLVTEPNKQTNGGVGGGFGVPLTVSVSYVYTGLMLGPMLSALTGPITLTSTTTMNNE